MNKEKKYISDIKNGDVDALVRLALTYYFGNDETIRQNTENALDLFIDLAFMAIDEMIIAQYYVLSKEVAGILRTKFGKTAIEFQIESMFNINCMANRKNPDALFAKSCIKYDIMLTDDKTEAPPDWEKDADFAAKCGSAWACLHLYTYYKGKNPGKALEYLKTGAKQTGVYAAKCRRLLKK